MAAIRDIIDGQFRDDETEQVGIGDFVTEARIREGVKKTRDIPTTYLEDGSHINDHIIRNPLIFTIEGQVSDVFQLPSPALAAFRETQAQIGAITQYAPARTQTQISKVSGLATDVQGLIDRADQAITTAGRFANFVGFTGDEGKTNIEKFIDFIDSVYYSDTLIKISAPFRTYTNMALTSIDYVRDNTTNSLSFSLEAQQVRLVESIFVDAGVAKNPAPATNGQTDGETDKGAQEGEEVEQSFAASIIELFR